MKAVVVRELGMEARRQEAALACGHHPAVVQGRQHIDPRSPGEQIGDQELE